MKWTWNFHMPFRTFLSDFTLFQFKLRVTVKTLIKVLSKNNSDWQRCLVWRKKKFRTLRGALFREVPSNLSATETFQSELQRMSYNRPRWRCRMWTGHEVGLDCCFHCERSRNYSTVLKVARVGCEISLNKKCPSKNIYAAKRCLS